MPYVSDFFSLLIYNLIYFWAFFKNIAHIIGTMLIRRTILVLKMNIITKTSVDQ